MHIHFFLQPKMSRPKEVLRGSHRAGVADSQKGTGFFIDFSSSGAAPKKNIIPKRLQEYGQSKRLSSEDLMEKQRMAEERKKVRASRLLFSSAEIFKKPL